MSLSTNALLRDQYVMLATHLGVTPVSDSLSSRQYLELNNGLLQQLLGGGTGGTPDPSVLTEAEFDAARARQTLTHTTALLLPGGHETPSFALGLRAVMLYTIGLSAPGRVRGYRNGTARDLDAARAYGVDPADGYYHDVTLDALLPDRGQLAVPVNAPLELTADGFLLLRVTNTGASAAALTVTLTYAVLEPLGGS